MSIIRSISSLTKYPAKCFSALPARAWLVTAVTAGAIFFYLRSTSQDSPASKKKLEQKRVEKKQVQKPTVLPQEKPKSVVTVSWSEVPSDLQLRVGEGLVQTATMTFNQLLRTEPLNADDKLSFKYLWSVPENVAVVDLRGLAYPPEWVARAEEHFGSEKLITD